MKPISIFQVLFLMLFISQGSTLLASEVNTVADLNGEYRIMVKASRRYLYEDGNSTKKVSTLQQTDDDFTRFILQRQADGSYRVLVKANRRHWHVDTSSDRVLSTRWQPNDDHTRFFFETQSDGTYRIKLKASGRYLYEDSGDKLISTRQQLTTDDTHFYLISTSVKAPNDVSFQGGTLSTTPIAGKNTGGTKTSTQDGDYVCTTQNVQAAQAINTNFIGEDASSSIVFPGAMIYSQDYFSGRYNLINAKRAPQIISTDIPFKSGSPEISVQNPNLANVRTAINQMMVQQRRGKENSQMTFEISEIYSEEQLNIALGGRFEYLNFSIAGTLNMDKSSSKRLVVAKFMQEYYSIDVEQPLSSYDMFTDRTEAEMIINSTKTPLYVSQVKYGRAAYFFLQTSESFQNIETTLNAAYDGATAKASGDFASKFDKLVQNNKMKVIAIGGNGNAIVKAVTGYEGFQNYILESGNLDPNSLGRPIAYTMRFLADQSVAHMNLTTSYTKRDCRKNTGRYKFKIKYVTCTYVSADEQGDDGGNDQNEVWGTIYTRLKKSRSDVNSYDDAFGSESNKIYLEENPSDGDGNKRSNVNIQREYSLPTDNIGQYEFYIRAVLWDHDTWSANDKFDGDVYIPANDANRSDYLEVKNGSDTIRIYYSIEPLE